MKKFLFMFMALALPFAGFAQEEEDEIPVNDVVITSKEAGKLIEALDPHAPKTVTGLKVIGEINGTDIAFIRSLCTSQYNPDDIGVLHKLDLSQAKIVEGGDPYYIDDGYGSTGEHLYTKENVIGKFMFYQCFKLDTLLIPETTTAIEKEALHGLKALKEFNIPQSVVNIGEGAFIDCKSLKTIAFPNHITRFPYRLLTRCEGLETVTYPTELKVICDGAFMSCYGLKDILIPEKVDSLGMSAYLVCESAKTISIPAGMKTISKFAFARCESVKEIYCYAKVPPTCPPDAFNDIDTEVCVLYVPKGTLADYQKTEGFSIFTTMKEIEEAQTLVLDEKDYNNTYDLEQHLNETLNVEIKRNVKAGEWDTFCFPFQLDAAGLKKVFGENVVLKEFDRLGNAEQGEPEYSIIMKDASAVKAGMPYLIKTDVTAETLRFEKVTVETSTTKYVEVEWGGDLFYFRGSFSNTDMMGSGAFLVGKDGNLFAIPPYSEEMQEYYVSGFTSYFLVPDDWKDKAVQLMLNGIVDGIENINTDVKQNGNIYTLGGQYVGRSQEQLAKGIYIVNGRKVVIR
ncbi:MAG: leucine-rich repeat domain-containing protein [Prevotella sp.]|nr:leucine-rich repeat domain-containing protein [Prevotella sp.]